MQLVGWVTAQLPSECADAEVLAAIFTHDVWLSVLTQKDRDKLKVCRPDFDNHERILDAMFQHIRHYFRWAITIGFLTHCLTHRLRFASANTPYASLQACCRRHTMACAHLIDYAQTTLLTL